MEQLLIQPDLFREERLHDPRLEWLETDGLGGFAMGTASGIRTRRYHGLLCAARTPPTGRVMLVNAVEAWVDLGAGPRALSSHRYLPATTHPDGAGRLVAFAHEPFPSWTYELENGVRVVHELFVPRGTALVVLLWRLEGPRGAAKLTLRPLLSVRDVHALRRESPALSLASQVEGNSVRWQPDRAMPGVSARTNGLFHSEPLWYRNFLYEQELARGYDHVEDLASPGFFEHGLSQGDACLILAAGVAGSTSAVTLADSPVAELARELRAHELARRTAQAPIERAAEAYVVQRGDKKSLIAGYPWFTDWGRDTFLSLRGLLLARGKVAEAAEILLAWADHVSHGMLPNRFPDEGEAEFNSVDASLWFVVAVEETLAAAKELPRAERSVLEHAALAILEGHAGGTRYGIAADTDGLLACGERGLQLTWMDAKIGGEVMTPRIGKPVEVQALWIQALIFGARFEKRFRALAEKASAAFEARFWNESTGYLNDVVDCDHVRGTADSSLRPNQVLAIGGLARTLVAPERARRVVEVLEQELWTPLGLRTLPRSDPRYHGRYAGSPLERDRAYHQGTVWPWLIGPFVEAWVRVQGSSAEARRLARERFLAPLVAHLADAGLGHVSEVADGDAPHTPGGCPFQAWSLGELLRLERVVLASTAAVNAPSKRVGSPRG
jgi:predicted glycogen debranching enzyme